MKKAILATTIVLLSVLGAKSQTYYYKYLYTVDKQSGMKKDPGKGDSGMHITFTNGKSACYQSNKDGTLFRFRFGPYDPPSDDRLSVYNFIGTQNGMHIYKQTRILMGSGLSSGGWNTYTFSQDYSRMNSSTTIASFLSNDIKVYERSTPPEEQSAPQQMY